MSNRPVPFIQRLVAQGLPPERIGDHFIVIRGSTGEIARARFAFESFSRRVVDSGGVAELHRRWAAVPGGGQVVCFGLGGLARYEVLGRVEPDRYVPEALQLLKTMRIDRRSPGKSTSFPPEWQPWLARQIVLHYVARYVARRLGRSVTIDTVRTAPEIQFSTRSDESASEALERLESHRQRLLASGDDSLDQAERLKLWKGVTWLFDGRNSKDVFDNTHDAIKHEDGTSEVLPKPHRDDPSKTVRRGRLTLERLLNLVTLELPTTH